MHIQLPFTLLQIIYLFFTYAFLGWVTEVAYAAAKHGKYSNRGFLIGPICPIYGYGVVIVLLALTPLKKHVILLFIGAVILTSALEYATGWYLEKKYNERWWDYSDNKFNVKGYICLEFSILWGLACVGVMYLVNPAILWVINKVIALKIGAFPAVFFLVVYIIDMIISSKRVKEFADKVKAIEVMDDAIRSVSDKISYNIYENVMDSKERLEDLSDDLSENEEIIELKKSFAEKHAENEKKKLELEKELFERRQKRDELLKESQQKFEKVLKKFPGIKEGRHKDIFKF